MGKLYVACKETGDFISEVNTIDEGLKMIKDFESEDMTYNVYTDNFYDVVDEEHHSLI